MTSGKNAAAQSASGSAEASERNRRERDGGEIMGEGLDWGWKKRTDLVVVLRLIALR